MIFLVKLFLAHILGDFVFQFNSLLKEKHKKKGQSFGLYLHILIHFILLFFLTGTGYWKITLCIASSHLLIDFIKLKVENSINRKALFFIDQCFHILILIAAWYITKEPEITLTEYWNNAYWLFLTAIVFLTQPVSIIIKILMENWTDQGR